MIQQYRPAAGSRRRRTCRDRWRYQRHPLRRSPRDPAMSVFMHLLAVLLAMAWHWPSAPRPAPRVPSASPDRVSRRDDWSPEAEARERGKGGHLMTPRWRAGGGSRYRSAPSYRRLLRDLRRPYSPARAEALDILRHRLDLPGEARGWLDEQSAQADWSPLAACVGGRTDADAEIAVLQAAVAWLEARAEGDNPPPPPPLVGRTGELLDEGSTQPQGPTCA